MTLGVEREGLAEPLRELAAPGTPILGTCAGLIMLDRDHLGLMDIDARRNAFGRRSARFEADLDIAGLDGGPVRAVFIRAPWIADAGEDVEILAAVDGQPSRRGRGGFTPSRSIPSCRGHAPARGLPRPRARAVGGLAQDVPRRARRTRRRAVPVVNAPINSRMAIAMPVPRPVSDSPSTIAAELSALMPLGSRLSALSLTP